MSYNWRDLPDTIGDLNESVNQFLAARWDREPEEEPRLKIVVWSNVFEDGGQVCLEIEGGNRQEVAKVSVENNGDVEDVKYSLEGLIEEWNENPHMNYENLVDHARQKVTSYSRRMIDEHTEKLAKYEAGDWS